MKKILKVFLGVALLLTADLNVDAEVEKYIRGIGYYFDEPAYGMPLVTEMDVCILGEGEDSFCEEYPVVWEKSDNPGNNNPIRVREVSDEVGFYCTIVPLDTNTSGETMTDVINRLTMQAMYAGYNLDSIDEFVMEINEKSMPYADMGSSSTSPLTFAVGGIEKIEYTVPELVAGEQPPKTVTIKTTPEAALITNEAEVVWEKSSDGVTYEEMIETDVLEEGLYYRYALKDETTVFNNDYINDSGLFSTASLENYVNGEEKEVVEAVFQAKAAPVVPQEPNPYTGDINSYINLGLLILTLCGTLLLVRKKNYSN